VPQEERDGPPQVSRMQRSASDRDEEVWEIDRIVARVEDKQGARRYRVHYTGYDDPNDDRWYDEEELRIMGRGTAQMLDEYDAKEDAKIVQQRIAPKNDAGSGVRRSSRPRKPLYFKGG
jgi:hypothetical protein